MLKGRRAIQRADGHEKVVGLRQNEREIREKCGTKTQGRRRTLVISRTSSSSFTPHFFIASAKTFVL